MVKPEINLSDFEKLDIRTGTIVSVSDFPAARNPTDLYTSDDLIGKQIIAIVNFPKKQIANFFSECLVLGVIGEKQEVTILTTTAPTANGLPIG